MASIYTTIQGDTWDLIAWKIYGEEKYMKDLIEANWPLIDVLVFSAGTEITVPELSEDSSDEDLPPWRDPDVETEEEDDSDEQFEYDDDGSDDEEGE